MNKKILSSAIAAALGFSFAANSSMATVDLDADTGTATFASELDIDSSGVLKPIIAGVTALNATAEMGFGFASQTGEAIYARYDLDNSAKWAVTLKSQNLEIGVSNASISLSQGGTTSQSFVIFNISPAANYPFAQTTAITLDLGDALGTPLPNYSGVTVVNKNPVNIRYRLYTSAQAASLATEGTALVDKTGVLLTFDPGLQFTAATSIATAEVTDDFLLFNTNDALDTARKTALISDISYGLSTNGALNKNVVTASITDLASTSTTLVVSGDFTAAATGGVYLSSNAVCGTTTMLTATISTDEKTATFAVGTNSSLPYLCFKSDGITPMIASEYLGTYKQFGDVSLGTIRRNGVELQSPFVALADGYVARFYLTNTSSKAVNFTAAAQTDPASGAACTLNAPFSDCAATANTTLAWGDGSVNIGCKIPANSSLLIKGPDLFSAGKRCTVTFRVAADASAVHGLYQQRTTKTTDFDSYLMISVGSPSGH